jgi:hypothetical protein
MKKSSMRQHHRAGPSRQQFSDECKRQRMRLICEGKAVEAMSVVQAALTVYNASSLEELGFNFNGIDELKKLKDLSRSTSTLILCASQSGAVVTIKDCVDVCLEFSDVPGATTFDDLGLGPAMQHREIRRMFALEELPADLQSNVVPPHTGDEIIRLMVERFAARQQHHSRGPPQQWTVDDFLDGLCQMFHVQNRLQLGVRINSFPLCIQSMSRAMRKAKKQVRICDCRVACAQRVFRFRRLTSTTGTTVGFCATS